MTARHRVHAVDFEGNTISDIDCNGVDNEFHDLFSQTIVTLTGAATRNKLIGGHYVNILLGASTSNNLVTDLTYNYGGGGGSIQDVSGVTSSGRLSTGRPGPIGTRRGATRR